MEKSASQKLRLGLFVLIGFLIFTLTVYYIGSKQQLFGKTEILKANFNNVNGLQPGNSVRFSGINAGSVKKIEIISDTLISVEMNIDSEVFKFIKKDAQASIGSDGLVGNMVVNILPGTGNMPSVKSGDLIQSEKKASADDLLKTLSKTNENAQAITRNFLEISEKINEGNGTLGMLLNDENAGNDLKNSVSDLRASIAYLKYSTKGTTHTINQLNQMISGLDRKENMIGVLKDSAVANRIKKVIVNLDHSSANINRTVDNLNATISNAKNGKGAINYLSNDTVLVNNIDSTMSNINKASYNLNQNLEALKHNIFFRGYFKKLEKQKKLQTEQK
ncbi:MlaD family protein [Chryseobacterium sp. HSC-36S06]|uniref:MlaD family protein n=1 Tax=Chryseobacterium sp. HSC-36S06 TaxID=2910970 RepID=UPI00209D5ABE|nr:MlaD family protein [Chryseobacterium sp. HSC-36S06]MCP2038613.1 phospholipid/cholesterol/gamma-HCH transport system substrate-binding protein [Chryseobacterium sp. HSC-36S06]